MHLWSKAFFLNVFLLLSLFVSFQFLSVKAEAKNEEICGYSGLYNLKYKANASHFDYVNKDAPKGGTLRIARVGTFDSLNFLRYPGTTLASRREAPFLITHYLFDSLLVKSADEAASYYCLAATKINIGPHLSSVRFTLNPKAVWHDGRPITVEDLLFTFNTLKQQGAPFYRQVLRTITAAKGKQGEIVYHNARPHDRNFVQIVGTLPIHPKHFWVNGKLTQKSMTIPLGSGPYRILTAKAGKFAHLQRVKNYWAKDHFANKGRFNFDLIEMDYFRDNTSALEGFKVGNYDVRLEKKAVTWANEYKGDQLVNGGVQKVSLPADHAGVLYMLAFNQRRGIFKNPNVRKALALLYDFESANKILFHNLYNRVNSLYGDTALAAKGPLSNAEKEFIRPFLAKLPSGISDKGQPDWQTSKLTWRQKVRQASQLLDDAGYVVKDGKRVDPKTGQPLSFTVSYLEPSHQRILLHYKRALRTVGIDLSLPLLEGMAARRKALDHDFDMIVLKWAPQLYAGKTEYLLWGSRLADAKGSYAFAGVKDPALDKAIDIMVKAKNQTTLTTGAQLFDRIFRWQIHAIPLWRRQYNWVALRQNFKFPKTYTSAEFTLVDRLWFAPQKQSYFDERSYKE